MDQHVTLLGVAEVHRFGMDSYHIINDY